jgi:hypothetical protein
MRRWLLMLVVLVAARGGIAQDRIPDDEAKKIARVLLAAGAKAKTPLKVEVDADRPYAKRKDEHGALILPAKELTVEALARAGADGVPVGHLWLKHLAPVAGDRVLSSKQLLIVPVTHEGKEHYLGLCCLAVREGKDGLDLLIHGKEKAPLVVAPLGKIDQKQELPIEFTVSIEPDQRATVNVTLLGKYRARVQVGVLVD